jgi:alkaline phosphatase D
MTHDDDPEIGPPSGTGRSMPRRDFLRGLAAAGAGSLAATLAWAPGRAHADDYVPSFPDGVKCGDPEPRGGVLWTRVATPPDDRAVPVMWSVAEDPAMQQVVRGGVAWARGTGGHHLKVRVRNLAPDRWYYYRFETGTTATVVGRLRTAPPTGSVPDRLRYAFASCQQRNDSHYVAHRAIANEGVDFLLHLGDYIYVHDFATLTLDDYRSDWRRFHSNPLLQEMQAAVPLVAVWDDGEFYNGVDRTGPPERLAAARAAFFEHMPVPGNGKDQLYRRFRWGRLAEMFLLDTRSYRDPEVPANTNIAGLIDGQDSALPPGEQMFAPGRTTLGARQKQWLKTRLARTGALWRLVGSSYNVNPWKIIDRDTPELRANDPLLQRNGGIYVSNEAWDDYQAERREILEHLLRKDVRNVVFTSGHTHIYLASELQPDFDDPTSPVTAFDFTTGSLTADPDPRTIAPEEILHFAEGVMMEANNPYLRHVDLLNQGYAVVDVTPDELVVEFRVLDTFDPNAEPRTSARFRILSRARTMDVTLFPSS